MKGCMVIHSRIKLGQNRIVFEIRHYYVKLSVGIAGSCVGLTIYPGVWYILIGTQKLGVYIFELLIRKESKHMPMQKKIVLEKEKIIRNQQCFFFIVLHLFYEEDFFFHLSWISRLRSHFGSFHTQDKNWILYISCTFVSYLKEIFLHAYVNVDELLALIIYERITVYRRIC